MGRQFYLLELDRFARENTPRVWGGGMQAGWLGVEEPDEEE